MLIQNILSYIDFINYLNQYRYVIVNISATWCKPCKIIKNPLEKFISVIDNPEFIYLKLDSSIYEEYKEFDLYFGIKQIPYFSFIKEGKIIDSFISGDFGFVSKRLFRLMSNNKEIVKLIEPDEELL